MDKRELDLLVHRLYRSYCRPSGTEDGDEEQELVYKLICLDRRDLENWAWLTSAPIRYSKYGGCY